MDVIQGRPSEATDDGDFARQLLAILGTAYSGPDGTNHAADALSLGAALADVRAVLGDALAEAFVGEATDLLTEHEFRYGLPVRTDLAPAARQTRLLAKVRALISGTPQDILTSVRTYDPTATLVETTSAQAGSEPDGGAWGARRGVFVASLRIASAVYADPVALPTILALVEAMKPAHTLINVCVTKPFLTDDPNSLTDRDVLGA